MEDVKSGNSISEASSLYTIEAEVIKACNCNFQHSKGQKFIIDVDGSFITKLVEKLGNFHINAKRFEALLDDPIFKK